MLFAILTLRVSNLLAIQTDNPADSGESNDKMNAVDFYRQVDFSYAERRVVFDIAAGDDVGDGQVG